MVGRWQAWQGRQVENVPSGKGTQCIYGHDVFRQHTGQIQALVLYQRNKEAQNTRPCILSSHCPQSEGGEAQTETTGKTPVSGPLCWCPACPVPWGGAFSSASSTLIGNLNPPASRHLAAVNTHADDSSIWVPEELHRIMSRSTSEMFEDQGFTTDERTYF